MTREKEHLGLSQLVELIHSELEESQRRREEQGRAPLFRVSSMDLEVRFVVSSEASVKGGLDIKVLSAGAGKVESSETVHRLCLHLESTSKGFDSALGAYPLKGE